MLYATGMSKEDMDKAQIGIASVCYDGNPCNMHLLDLATQIKEGVLGAGRIGLPSIPSGSRTASQWYPRK